MCSTSQQTSLTLKLRQCAISVCQLRDSRWLKSQLLKTLNRHKFSIGFLWVRLIASKMFSIVAFLSSVNPYRTGIVLLAFLGSSTKQQKYYVSLSSGSAMEQVKKGSILLFLFQHRRQVVIASVLPEKNWTIFLLTVTLVDEISVFAMFEVYYCFLDFISSLIRPRRQIKNY